MSNKYERVERKAESEFLDSRFTRLADRFYGDFEHPPENESWTDPRFSSGPAEVDALLKDEIVKFANSDPDAQRLLAEAGVRDQSAKSSFRTRGWEGECHWDDSSKKWVFDIQNLETQEVRTLFISGRPDDVDRAKSMAARELAEYSKTARVRVLGPDQVLLLQRIASQDAPRAFEVGLGLMFTEFQDEEGFNPYDVISHEAFQEPLRQLTWYIFLGTPAADKLSSAESEKFREFATNFIGNRPWNLNILKTAFEAFRNKTVTENLQELDRKISQPEQVTPADLDSLSDEEIDATFDSVSREYIKSRRRN